MENIKQQIDLKLGDVDDVNLDEINFLEAVKPVETTDDRKP